MTTIETKCARAVALGLALAAGAAAPALAGITERVNVGPGGAQANDRSRYPALSADGRIVAFASTASNLVPSDTNGIEDTFVRDRQTGQTTRVSVGPGEVQVEGDESFGSFDLGISADGKRVVFDSRAAELVPGDTNGKKDVFVHTR